MRAGIEKNEGEVELVRQTTHQYCCARKPRLAFGKFFVLATPGAYRLLS
jgi:hypothetical protein